MAKSAAQRQAEYRERYPDKIQDYKTRIKLDGSFNEYRRDYRLHTLKGWAANCIERLSNKANPWIYTITAFDILDIWRKQNGRCAVTGLRLNIEAPKRHPTRPSVDRIDCKKGYHKENIRLVWSWVNISRADLGDKTFKKLCQIVSRVTVV